MTFVYMIRDAKNRLYIGVSDDPKQRLSDHNHKLGAKFTNAGRFSIVFLEQYENLQQARTREVQIKKWRREKKEMLINRYLAGLKTRNE